MRYLTEDPPSTGEDYSPKALVESLSLAKPGYPFEKLELQPVYVGQRHPALPAVRNAASVRLALYTHAIHGINNIVSFLHEKPFQTYR